MPGGDNTCIGKKLLADRRCAGRKPDTRENNEELRFHIDCGVPSGDWTKKGRHVRWILCLTLKMSRGGKWREPCASRDRDIYRSWLHRIVRLSFIFGLQRVSYASKSFLLFGLMDIYSG
jgi:hypothetical protein